MWKVAQNSDMIKAGYKATPVGKGWIWGHKGIWEGAVRRSKWRKTNSESVEKMIDQHQREDFIIYIESFWESLTKPH